MRLPVSRYGIAPAVVRGLLFLVTAILLIFVLVSSIL